jgi:hypothetical protein
LIWETRKTRRLRPLVAGLGGVPQQHVPSVLATVLLSPRNYTGSFWNALYTTSRLLRVDERGREIIRNPLVLRKQQVKPRVVMRVHHIGVVEVRLDLVSFSQFGHVVGDREF